MDVMKFITTSGNMPIITDTIASMNNGMSIVLGASLTFSIFGPIGPKNMRTTGQNV